MKAVGLLAGLLMAMFAALVFSREFITLATDGRLDANDQAVFDFLPSFMLIFAVVSIGMFVVGAVWFVFGQHRR